MNVNRVQPQTIPFTLRYSISLSCMVEQLAVESGWYLITNNGFALIGTYHNASQRNIDGVRLNRTARW